MANESNPNLLVEMERTLKELQEKIKVLKNAQPLTSATVVSHPLNIYFQERLVNGSSTATTMAQANKVCKQYIAAKPAQERSDIWCVWNGMNFTKFGPVLTEMVEASVDVSGENDEQANFSVTFDASAMYGDVYISEKLFRGTKPNSESLNYLIFNSDSGVEKNGEATASITSTADTETINGSKHYVIRGGETESITVNVSFKPTTFGVYKMQLSQISYLFGNAKLSRKFKVSSGYSTDLVYVNGNSTGCISSASSSDCSAQSVLKVDFKKEIISNGRFVVTANYEIKNYVPGLSIKVRTSAFPFYEKNKSQFKFDISHGDQSYKGVSNPVEGQDGYVITPNSNGKGKITIESCGLGCFTSIGNSYNIENLQYDLTLRGTNGDKVGVTNFFKIRVIDLLKG